MVENGALAGRAGLVFAGGFAGTLTRYGVGLALPVRHGWPLGTLTVNVTGSFLLAFLLERLARSGPESPGRRQARLLLGTGFCGGFTTYSALAVETERLLATGHAATAFGYAAASLVAGLLAVLAGFTLAGRRRAGGVP